MVEFFLRFTTTFEIKDEKKIDFIGIAPLRVTKTSLLWPTNKNRNKHLKINIISLRIPAGRGQTIWLYTSLTGGFNSGLVYREQIQLVVRVAIELEAFAILPLYTPLGYAASSRMRTVLAIPRSWYVCFSAYFASSEKVYRP